MSKINQKQLKSFSYTTLAEIKLDNTSRDGIICYCNETETYYKFLANGSSFTPNDEDILITGKGGNTRWIAFSGKFSFKDADRIIYDNTNSNLTSNNVQDAIDEIQNNNSGWGGKTPPTF